MLTPDTVLSDTDAATAPPPGVLLSDTNALIWFLPHTNPNPNLWSGPLLAGTDAA